MKPVSFDYHQPTSVAEAVEILAEHEDAKVLAGGQSLIPLMNYRLAAPAHLVDISRLAELRTIEVTGPGSNNDGSGAERSEAERSGAASSGAERSEEESSEAARSSDRGSVIVGAAVTHSELRDHEGAAAAIPLLREAENLIAHEVIRNRGTVCGSLAHADPSGELTAVLSLLGGHVRVVSVDGERTIPADELFEGPLQSSLAENELLIEATFPRPATTTATAFRETARRHGDYAVCGVACAVDRSPDGSLSGATAVFISMAPTPLRVDLGPIVAGRHPREIDRGALYDFATAQVDPAADIHATVDYRRHLAGVLVCQAVEAGISNGATSS